MQLMKNGFRTILIAVAHPSEEEAVRRATEAAGCGCEILVTGVGGAAASWALQKRFSSAALPALVIGAGIAGSYSETLPTGSVVTTVSDCFADMGVDDNGSFTSLFGAGLADPDKPPFTGGRIICNGRWFDLAATMLPFVAGATVNMASGSQPVIERIRRAWNPGIETMEGAWLAYTCTMAGIPWIAVRAVSNMVEPRNLKNWDIPIALRNLEEKMTRLLELLTGNESQGIIQ
jgi:futalosine hydrolase